jgi:hypothetical protein
VEQSSPMSWELIIWKWEAKKKKRGLGRKEWVHDHKTPHVLEAQELSAPCGYA